jgi:hypothetical protein
MRPYRILLPLKAAIIFVERPGPLKELENPPVGSRLKIDIWNQIGSRHPIESLNSDWHFHPD